MTEATKLTPSQACAFVVFNNIRVSGISLIWRADIKYVNSFQKFKVKVPGSVGKIGNFDITIFFIDSFKFNNNEGRNHDDFETKQLMQFASYRNHNENIINSINSFHN